MTESTPPPPPPEGSIPPPPPPPGETPPPAPPAPPADYPVDLQVDFPHRELNKTTTFFRFFTVLPIAIILGMLGGGFYVGGYGAGGVFVMGVAGLLALPTALMIVFREKYPRWWYDFNVQLLAFTNRVVAYFLLLDDRYPSTDEEQYAHLTVTYPDVKQQLNRWLPLFKWLLAIPHYIALFFLGIGVLFATIFAWFSILFTGKYPEDIFDFVVGVLRWSNRVVGYTALLVTDEYPPFRLSP